MPLSLQYVLYFLLLILLKSMKVRRTVNLNKILKGKVFVRNIVTY